MSGRANFSRPAGDTFIRTVTWEGEDGDEVDLSGYAAELLVFDDQGAVVLEANTETVGGIEYQPTDNALEIEVQTAAVAAGCYRYTLVLVSTDGIITTLLEGSFNLE